MLWYLRTPPPPTSPLMEKIEYAAPAEEAEERQAKRHRKQVHKLQLAVAAKSEIATHEAAGRILVFTDGSAEWVKGVGWIGGWGCHSPQGWESASHLPPHTRQTVNRAELRAVLEVVMHFGQQAVQVAVMTDSSYVHSGLQGNAMRWRANGWVSAQGPVTNVDLWIDLMQILDVSLAQFSWVKVPSHAGIPGNDRADELALAGRLSSPLYATVRARVPPPPHPPGYPPKGPFGR